MTIVGNAIGTDSEGARAFLGCTVYRFKELRRTGVIKPLGDNWYSYEDLVGAIEHLRNKRDDPKAEMIQLYDEEARRPRRRRTRTVGECLTPDD